MSETARLMLMLALAGSVVTFMGSAAIWLMDPQRRMARALKRVLKGWPDAVALSPATGRGAGLSLNSGLAAVCWDDGAWCLIYRLEEVSGAELKVDGQVVGRVVRDEPRRTLDRVSGAIEHVTLRLVFDDPRHPDFDIDLWTDGDQLRRVALSPAQAMVEANRWLSRIEALLRKTRPAPAVNAAPPVDDDDDDDEEPAPAPAPAKRPARPAKPSRDDDDDMDELPF